MHTSIGETKLLFLIGSKKAFFISDTYTNDGDFLKYCSTKNDNGSYTTYPEKYEFANLMSALLKINDNGNGPFYFKSEKKLIEVANILMKNGVYECKKRPSAKIVENVIMYRDFKLC